MHWSQSYFLQSLGWAILNSFWQMGLLWCLYMAATVFLKLSSSKKYRLSVAAIIAGFVWFVFTFFYSYKTKETLNIPFFNVSISESNSLLNIFLIPASVAYLSLLIFPAYGLFKNWQFVQRIKKQGLQKAGLNDRMFVQKIAAQLGIKKKVFVYLSALVKSPLTVGYFKPIVLLPLSCLSNLSIRQVEAILLHELSHIRRYDYVLNFMISIISTFLYFNPFAKLLIKNMEEEREHCCDQFVLQFGYDKVSYASALLTLEKLSSAGLILTLGATGKSGLLKRIEKITGMENKKQFKKNHFAAALAALLCIVFFNSVIIMKEKKQNKYNSYAYTDFANAFNFIETSEFPKNHSAVPVKQKTLMASAQKPSPPAMKNRDADEGDADPSNNNIVVNVASDDVENTLTKEQKDKVKLTVAATKKVYNNLQWKEVEMAIADVMTEHEKTKAKQDYLNVLESNVNWKNVEQNMKAQYQKLNWEKVDANLGTALAMIQLDSLQKIYTVALSELNRLTDENKSLPGKKICLLPDQSLEFIEKSKAQLSGVINNIKAVSNKKKVVRL